jgi:hypothetical protein
VQLKLSPKGLAITKFSIYRWKKQGEFQSDFTEKALLNGF